MESNCYQNDQVDVLSGWTWPTQMKWSSTFIFLKANLLAINVVSDQQEWRYNSRKGKFALWGDLWCPTRSKTQEPQRSLKQENLFVPPNSEGYEKQMLKIQDLTDQNMRSSMQWPWIHQAAPLTKIFILFPVQSQVTFPAGCHLLEWYLQCNCSLPHLGSFWVTFDSITSELRLANLSPKVLHWVRHLDKCNKSHIFSRKEECYATSSFYYKNCEILGIPTFFVTLIFQIK